MPCECPATKFGQGYNEWIQNNMQDCIYTPLDMAAFVIGMSSLAFWICCQAPQFIKNWRNGTAEALSLWFLLEWLGGDVSNMVGTILTRQVPTQTYTAILFVVMDICILSQYAFLHFRNKWRREKAEKEGLLPPPTGYENTEEGCESSDTEEELAQIERGNFEFDEEQLYKSSRANEKTVNTTYGETNGQQEVRLEAPLLSKDVEQSKRTEPMPTSHAGTNGKYVAGATVMMLMTITIAYLGLHQTSGQEDDGLDVARSAGESWNRQLDLDNCEVKGGKPTPHGRDIAGQALGYLSTVLYLNSRLPQVWKNYKRQSVVGLSWLMFFCAFMGNFTTVISIVMRIQGDFDGDQKKDWKAEAPFFPGAAGTLVFDFLIMFQYFIYTKRARKRRERRALLRKRAKGQMGQTPSNLQDTPALVANAPRGIHDIVESPPVRRDEDVDVYGTTQNGSLGTHAKDDSMLGRGKYSDKAH
eukprot:gb/GECG01008907.1/.p1 GENE.gb/GECG01008907.1/~~gb/GECG01008907.1/.p1  ORF type:complete len:471 (+),score=52.10 gb/GECG01008907.1/:1-1413(+)